MKKLSSYVLLILFSCSYLSVAVTLNNVADTIIEGLMSGKEMILKLAYIGGLGFLVASFYKFKQHKDNPTQVPIGNPLTMMVIAVLLMFMASMIMPVGETFFGKEAGAGIV